MSETASPEPPKPPRQIGKPLWELGAPHWTDRTMHPIMGRDTERSRAIRTLLARFTPELRAAKSIVDIGSGGGLDVYFSESFASKVTAIDFSRAMLEGNPSAHKLEADIREPFDIPDNSINLATQFFLNRYLTPEQQAQEMSEIARVLAKNGRVIILDYTEITGQPDEIAKFDPEALIRTPAGEQFRDWEIEEVLASHQNPNDRIRQGSLYLLTGVKK